MASIHVPRSASIAAALTLAAACGDETTAPTSLPLPEPASFVATVTNQYFPLLPGTTWSYESSDGSETNTVEVLGETKNILGITATVVHDQVFSGGELTEDTFDWYAQDSDGNVWYLGEDSREIENGQVVSTEGSWEGSAVSPGASRPKTGTCWSPAARRTNSTVLTWAPRWSIRSSRRRNAPS